MLQMWDMHRVVDITFYPQKTFPFLFTQAKGSPHRPWKKIMEELQQMKGAHSRLPEGSFFPVAASCYALASLVRIFQPCRSQWTLPCNGQCGGLMFIMRRFDGWLI